MHEVSFFFPALRRAAFVLEAEFRPQQAARIVRHALEPGLVREPAFALLGGFVFARGFPRRLPAFLARLLQGALHSLALRLVGLLLRLRVLRLCIGVLRLLLLVLLLLVLLLLILLRGLLLRIVRF